MSADGPGSSMAEGSAGDPEVARWRELLAQTELLAAAAEVVRTGVSAAAIERLRRGWDPTSVTMALQLAEARLRARAKFAAADGLVCDRQAVEQASGERVALWKARRFARAIARIERTAEEIRVWDLCSGMGGDAMALAELARGTERPAPRVRVIAVDRSPVRAWMAATNARCDARIADVRDLLHDGALDGAFVHCDPARRDEARGARTLTPIHEPSLEVCIAVARRATGAALKLGPGLDPALLPDDAELEWISDEGTLVQLVAWWGRLREADGGRQATRVGSDPDDVVTIRGPIEGVPCVDRFAAMLAVPDPALERSRLLGHFARLAQLAEPAAGLGILTAEAIAPSPWLERARILAVVPFDEDAVVAELKRRGAQRARVRTRGGVADADRWTQRIARTLSGGGGSAPTGERELDCFLLRVGVERLALIAQPLPDTLADR